LQGYQQSKQVKGRKLHGANLTKISLSRKQPTAGWLTRIRRSVLSAVRLTVHGFYMDGNMAKFGYFRLKAIFNLMGNAVAFAHGNVRMNAHMQVDMVLHARLSDEAFFGSRNTPDRMGNAPDFAN
jgi:hypothetical protein